MKKIVENTSKYLAMSKEENKEFLDNLYSLMKKLEADVVDYQGLKILSAPPLCPDCRSNHIIKNGLQNGMQNYRCKDCGRQFRVTTGTFVYRLQKKEKMLDYIRCMVAGTSSETFACYHTSDVVEHFLLLLQPVNKSSSGNPKLSATVFTAIVLHLIL